MSLSSTLAADVQRRHRHACIHRRLPASEHTSTEIYFNFAHLSYSLTAVDKTGAAYQGKQEMKTYTLLVPLIHSEFLCFILSLHLLRHESIWKCYFSYLSPSIGRHQRARNKCSRQVFDSERKSLIKCNLARAYFERNCACLCYYSI